MNYSNTCKKYFRAKSLLFGLLLVTLIGCNSPLNKTFSLDTFDQDCAELKASLDRDDYKLIVDYIEKNEIKQMKRFSLTYGQVLKIARAEDQRQTEELGRLADRLEKASQSLPKSGVQANDSPLGDSKAIAEVEKTLKDFSKAYYSADYKRVKKFYSKKYFEGFKEYVEKAKNIKKDEIYALNVLDGANILKIKKEFDLNELNTMSLQDQYDAFNQSNVIVIRENPSIVGPVSEADDSIIAYFNMGGNFKKQVTFEKEGEEWKINLWDTEDEKVRKQKEMISQFNLDKKEFLGQLMANVEFAE